MHFLKLLATLSPLVSAVHGYQEVRDVPSSPEPACRPADYVPALDATDVPRRFGIVIFNGTDPLDWNGPAEVLFALGLQYKIEFYHISENLDVVTTQGATPLKSNSTIWMRTLPGYTYASPPPDLDAIIVPGGPGARIATNPAIDFVRDMFPARVKHFISTCTGAMIAARAGVLDGRRATANKAAWNQVVPLGPNVDWQGEARWVVDGPVWTSSGVSAGIDAMVAYIACYYGEQVITKVLKNMEYMRHPDPSIDPYAVWPNGTYKYV